MAPYIASIEARDKYTVVIRMAQVHAGLTGIPFLAASYLIAQTRPREAMMLTSIRNGAKGQRIWTSQKLSIAGGAKLDENQPLSPGWSLEETLDGKE